LLRRLARAHTSLVAPDGSERGYCPERQALTGTWHNAIDTYRRVVGELQAERDSIGFYAALDEANRAWHVCQLTRQDLLSHVAGHRCLFAPGPQRPVPQLGDG
jgi:hypothetical protein